MAKVHTFDNGYGTAFYSTHQFISSTDSTLKTVSIFTIFKIASVDSHDNKHTILGAYILISVSKLCNTNVYMCVCISIESN